MGFGAWDNFATTVFAAVLDARQLQCLDAAYRLSSQYFDIC